jgi:uncharacterized protein (TIGR03118 family)
MVRGTGRILGRMATGPQRGRIMFRLPLSRGRGPRVGRRVVARALSATVVVAVLLPAGVAPAANPIGYNQVNLVSDVPGLAHITDFRVANTWGLALGPTTPLWINNDDTATAEVYAGANGHDPLSLKLVVQLPASPTGIVFNPTSAFRIQQGTTTVPSFFIFNGQDGYTSAWGLAVNPPTSAVPMSFFRQRGYLGLAVARTPAGPRLFAADFRGMIDIFDGHFKLLSVPGAFVDPGVPAGMGPYNVTVFGSRVFVTYASPNGPGGAIDVYDLSGTFIRRLATGGPLNAPWGMAMAPAHWGRFGGMLLVGNVNDGRINAFDPTTGAFRGVVRDSNGSPIVNSGLWGLVFGNGQTGTPRDLLFGAGIDGYSHGLVGMIRPN